MIKFNVKGQEFKVDSSLVVCNDITFDHEFNPHNVRAFMIFDLGIPIAVVWADSDTHAIDIAIENYLMNSCLVDCENCFWKHLKDDSMTCLDRSGNYPDSSGDCLDLEGITMEVLFLKDQPLSTLLLFAEARGFNAGKLSEIA